MATIAVSDLNLTGSTLLIDEESYLRELSEGDLNIIQGGSTPLCVVTAISITLLLPAEAR